MAVIVTCNGIVFRQCKYNCFDEQTEPLDIIENINYISTENRLHDNQRSSFDLSKSMDRTLHLA